jgi:hypothetical protein
MASRKMSLWMIFSTRLLRISLAIAIQTSGISTPALVSIRRIGGMIQLKWWPTGAEPAKTLRARQAQLLLAAGNPETDAAPVWRRVNS